MSMITELPSSTTPGGKIIWTISNYNLTGVKTPNPAGDPVKLCLGCLRHLPLTEFLVKEEKGKLKGKEFMFLSEDGGLCRDCHPVKTDFTLYKVKGKLMMRIRELRQTTGQPLDLWDPFAIGGWSEIQSRPTRLMDKTPNKVRMQPSNYRSYVDGQRVTPKKYSAAPGHKPKAAKTRKPDKPLECKKEPAVPERKLKPRSQDLKTVLEQLAACEKERDELRTLLREILDAPDRAVEAAGSRFPFPLRFSMNIRPCDAMSPDLRVQLIKAVEVKP